MTKPKEKALDLESELPFKKKKKQSLWTKIISSIQPQTMVVKKKAPLTFNIGVSVALFFVYFSIMITVGTSYPIIFLFILPVLYIIARHIKLEREQDMPEVQEPD